MLLPLVPASLCSSPSPASEKPVRARTRLRYATATEQLMNFIHAQELGQTSTILELVTPIHALSCELAKTKSSKPAEGASSGGGSAEEISDGSTDF